MRRLTAKLKDLLVGSETAAAIHVLLLLTLCGVLYFPYLGQVPFFDKGEPREALAVQDIVERGEWLFPLKRAAAIPSKPPLFHWSAALVSRMKGELDEATIRLPSAFYATLGVLVVFVLGRKLFGAEVGLVGGAILATTMLYGKQALSARVDMTLCFFVTASLALFYSLYRGLLTRQLWFYVFYAVVGVGALAKGPLGILLPALVAGSFALLKQRWDLISKFCLHPGAILTLLLALGWYAIAITRGGEGFVNRQLLEENLERFFGGSGHSHPFYYYIPYLFSQGLPWSLFLPFVLWDSFKKSSLARDDKLFLALWLAVMFVFFSLSLGKRPVYLLPVYPALALVTAVWIDEENGALGVRRLLHRVIAVIAALTGIVLLLMTLGALWNHDPGWLLSPIEGRLKPKDRANLLVVKNSLANFGWSFTLVALLSAALWLSLARSLWAARLRAVAPRLVLVSVLGAFVGWRMVMPVIAEARSYRAFMGEVNRRVTPSDKLFLFGGFNSDGVEFYRGRPIEPLNESLEAMAAKIGPGEYYVIMPQQTWAEIQKRNPSVPTPLLKSDGAGPEGDAPLVLVQVGS